MDYMITTKQLTKTYKSFVAVNNVSLNIPKGSIYGLLGPNGAGKSTTMKMLLGLTAPTKGSFTINGGHFPDDRISILKKTGSFIESPSFYANLTGGENLDIIRRILGLPKSAVTDALELVGLSEFGGRLARKYSLGMKQRLGLAGALLGRPPVLILDEPTNGLDPAGIHEIRNLVKSLPGLYDCTVLISSHMLSEIELMADYIGILNHGRLLFEGSLYELRQNAHPVKLEIPAKFQVSACQKLPAKLDGPAKKPCETATDSSTNGTSDLEDIFLSMIEKDNALRKQGAKL